VLTLQRGAARIRALVACLTIAASVACGGGNERPARVPIAEVRDRAKNSKDADVVANWLIAELVQPGGSAKGSLDARRRLNELGTHGLMPSLARAFDDSMHGRLTAVSD